LFKLNNIITIGVYLTDLTFIEDGNADHLKTSSSTELINFSKHQKTAEVILEIQQFQKHLYALTEVPELQSFIIENFRENQDENDLYEMSLLLEPREREDEKIARLLHESGFL